MFLRRFIGLGLLVTVLAAGSATYAVAASEQLTTTDAPPRVSVAGLSVLHASYERDPARPDRVAALRLRLASQAQGTILTTLDGGATWLECTARGSALRCPVPGGRLTVQDATALALAPSLG